MEALADGTRRRIVELLAERDRTAGELADAFEISRPGVSRHLRVLREAGLVRAQPDAQRRIAGWHTYLEQLDADLRASGTTNRTQQA
jgi:DNA-binding transcriptional ArsR family regulator